MQEMQKETMKLIQEAQAEVKANVLIVQEESEKMYTAMIGNKETITGLQTEIASNKHQLVVNTNNLSEIINRINTELRGEIRVHKEETVKVQKT